MKKHVKIFYTLPDLQKLRTATLVGLLLDRCSVPIE
jgi:hypothetical protein